MEEEEKANPKPRTVVVDLTNVRREYKFVVECLSAAKEDWHEKVWKGVEFVGQHTDAFWGHVLYFANSIRDKSNSVWDVAREFSILWEYRDIYQDDGFECAKLNFNGDVEYEVIDSEQDTNT